MSATDQANEIAQGRPGLVEYYEERAAIREFDGNLPRWMAERGALAELKRAIAMNIKLFDAAGRLKGTANITDRQISRGNDNFYVHLDELPEEGGGSQMFRRREGTLDEFQMDGVVRVIDVTGSFKAATE